VVASVRHVIFLVNVVADSFHLIQRSAELLQVLKKNSRIMERRFLVLPDVKDQVCSLAPNGTDFYHGMHGLTIEMQAGSCQHHKCNLFYDS
jgi:hypothetical protein